MPAASIQPTVTLTDEQVAFFRREGYLAIPSITSPEELARLREIYDGLFSSKAGRDDGNQFDLGGTDEEGKEAVLPQILNPRKYAPELEHTLYAANAAAISRQLLGADASARGEHMIYKPARTGAATPWHQDQAYHDPAQDYDNVNVWMPLQDATVENGCMQFVPRSHTWDVLPHHPIGHDPRVHGLEVDEPERYAAQAVACPLPAGGACFHRSYLLHYAGANRSDLPRRAYIMVFGLPSKPARRARHFPWQQRETTRQARLKAKAM
ncbi:MAG: phytanoyl-CoA dioxygenase family protein [Planctomycetota bacterium]|nr:phytanoyl-CoA dioxygenase family protein [Planctomycetota bacterium]